MKKYKTQVKKSHYNRNNYDGLGRFISYYHQANILTKFNPKNILEIGPGNKTMSNYLKKNGVDIKTCDFDKTLSPDIVASVLNLPIKDDFYDVACAFEVLEHLEFKDSIKALREMKRVAKKAVILSLPYSSIYFNFHFNSNFLGGFRIINKEISIRIPQFFRNAKFDGEHYWEIGRKRYSLRKIRKILKKEFRKVIDFRTELNPRQHFFILYK